MRRIEQGLPGVRCAGGKHGIEYRTDDVYVESTRFEVYFAGLSRGGVSPSRRVKRLVFEAYEGKCFACGAQLTPREATCDHIEPRSAGGLATLANLQLLCLGCNAVKSDVRPTRASYVLHFPLVPAPNECQRAELGVAFDRCVSSRLAHDPLGLSNDETAVRGGSTSSDSRRDRRSRTLS
jgi:5-methylcytosine-specific restriction endonuclease McrA